MTSGLVRLIGGCTLYRLGRPRLSLRPLSSPSVPHHLYRGPKSRGRNFKSFAPHPWRRLCPRPTERRAQLGNEWGEGRGFLHGGRSKCGHELESWSV